jgi:glutaredoxin
MAGGPQDLSELEKDPRLFLYTSLTAGSSHIVTATSRIETILRANRIPFQYIDTATDEKAKRLWIRRAGKRKLPALVKDGFVIGVCELLWDNVVKQQAR